MKRHTMALILVLAWSTALWAVPSFTPLLDGVKDLEWGNTPDHATTTLRQPVEFNLDSGLYVTDDSEFIYFGFHADPDPWPDGRNVHVHILVDVGSTAAGGHFDPWGAGGVVYGHPFLPDYDIITQWNTGNQNVQFTGLLTWTGSSWSQVELTTDAGGGGQFTEIALRRVAIGSPAQGTVLNLSMWLRPAWDKWGGNCCLPADEDFPSDWADGGGTFNTQFAYTIQTALADSDPPGIEIVRQIDRTGIEITFDEPMDTTSFVSGNIVPTGWTFTGFRYKTLTTVGISVAPPGFGAGTLYGVALTPGIRDLAQNSIDPNDDEATWTGRGYANVTVTAIDLSETHDQIFFKGSFNFYHEYDNMWSGGSHRMYDDGTHGDPLANDHQFTLVWPLLPHTPDNYEWGLEDENQNWLIIGPNQSFALPDTNSIAVSYTIPDVTGSPVTVTFRCDMQFVTDPIDGVQVAGSFNGWNGAAMSDTDGDGQWTLNVLFPAGSQRQHEFKFQRIEGTNTNWESIGNRGFEVDESGPAQDLGNMFFNDVLASPYNLTAYPVTGGVRLQWNTGYQRVAFDVFTHSSPDSISQNGSLLAPAVPTNFYVDADLSAIKKFYEVRTVEP